MSAVVSRSVLFFRTYLSATMPLYEAIVSELCAGPELPFELASTLEDIGQEFIRFSEQLNAELLRRGILGEEAEADETTEAKIDGIFEDLLAALQTNHPRARMRARVLLSDENVRQALRTALLMTHDVPRVPAPG